MTNDIQSDDPYLNIQLIPDYYLVERVGEGKIGFVYRAERTDPVDTLACKVIPEGKLKSGWQRELEKAIQLKNTPNIVIYHSHGTHLNKEDRPFTWVLWNFIDGDNLHDLLKDPEFALNMPFIGDILEVLLGALYSCNIVDTEHGDLHEGNIMIARPDKRIREASRKIWVTDFGYGGSHNDIEPKNDYRQLYSIVSNLLKRIDISGLGPRDKILHLKLEAFLRKRFLEEDRTQGSYVGDIKELLKEFNSLNLAAEKESAAAAEGRKITGVGDYLVAEALGYGVEEWKQLFVPEFLAAKDLLGKTITVLTGARGCGKTMSFRRLTAFMDLLIGESSGVSGSDQFIGFYINCRDLVEAFPWLPRRLSKGMQQQIIHYFHIVWLVEVCKTLSLFKQNSQINYAWLDGFLLGTFGEKYRSFPKGRNILASIRSFLEQEREFCRITDLGNRCGLEAWPLSRVDYLDDLQIQLESNISWIGDRPLYLFLDDYTIPIIPREVQKILNPIIFKRRDRIFFKISTESSNSFVREGVRGKPLEVYQDFELIDLASESIHQKKKEKTIFLDKIFKPRIQRHELLKGQDYGLERVLGKVSITNNDLAKKMRKSDQQGSQKRILYHGIDTFVGMWTSDIRIMIQMLTSMLRESEDDLKKGAHKISASKQDQTYRVFGGEFLGFIDSLVDPKIWEEGGPSSTGRGEKYGTHLKNIVEAFVNVSRYELIKGNLVKNQGLYNPKQAFRIEIIDKFELPDRMERYLEGLIRWHIFLQDWRGKSIRGMITPRIYLNRALIPYCNLTFSSKDSIALLNREMKMLLDRPKDFQDYWKTKRKKGDEDQNELGL